MGYLRCITPNRTRQAIFAIAYIFMAAAVAVATAAVVSHGVVGPESVATDNGEAMVVKFTNTRTGRESVVTIPAVDVQAIGQAEDSLTIEEMIVGMRIMSRRPPTDGATEYDLQSNSMHTVRLLVLKNELNCILRRYTKWSAEEETRLRDVLAMYYPKLTVID